MDVSRACNTLQKKIFYSFINYCNSLQTQTKVAIAGAVVVCSAAFAYFYYAKRCENNAETVVVLDVESRTEEKTELPSIDKSENALRVMPTAYLKPSCSDVKPQEGGQLCLIDRSIEIYLDISTIPEEIRAFQSIQRNKSVPANGRKSANELVCDKFYSRQLERSEFVVQVKEVACYEFQSREKVRWNKMHSKNDIHWPLYSESTTFFPFLLSPVNTVSANVDLTFSECLS